VVSFNYLLFLWFLLNLVAIMTKDDLIDYSPDPLDEGIFRHSSDSGMTDEVVAIGYHWSKGFSAAKPFPVVGDSFSLSEFLLSFPRKFLLPDYPFLLEVGVFAGVKEQDPVASGSTMAEYDT